MIGYMGIYIDIQKVGTAGGGGGGVSTRYRIVTEGEVTTTNSTRMR